MPLVRFKIRNELSLAKPELNRSAAVENEEPKAILGAIEVAGLVGILRQLGDLAEFSAEVFNGIQEEVTVTASRCQKLTSRVKRIESALSPLEKAVLSQTSHIHFAYTAGCEWHPRIRNGHGHFVQSDLPLCVMETYEQCRDPPPLHLLDKFDVNGPGSCLRKYSDPTFFRKNLNPPSKADDVRVQKDQAHRKRKKRRLPERNICRSRAVSTSEETNGTRISSLTDDKHTAESTSTVDMPRSSNLQELSDIVDQSHLQDQIEPQVQSDFRDSSKPRDSITGSGYIEYVINQSPVDTPEVKLLEGFLTGSLQPADRISSGVPQSCIEVVDDNMIYNSSEDLPVPCASTVCDEKKATVESKFEKLNKDEKVSEIHELKFGPETPDRVRQNQRDFDRSYILFDEVDIVEEKQSESQTNIIDGTLGTENEGESKSEQGSESDEFVDARNTIESESESEYDGTPKPNLEHYFGDISTYCSEDANSDNNDGSEDMLYESMAEETCHDDSLDESCSGSYFPEDEYVSCFLSDPVSGKAMSHDDTFQRPNEFAAISPSLPAKETVPDKTILRAESVVEHPLLAGEKISFEKPVSPCPSVEDAMPTEKILPEGHFTSYSFFTEAVPQKKILAEDPCRDDSLVESCSGLYFSKDTSDSVSGKAMSHDETIQRPNEFAAMSPSLLAEETVPHKILLQEEPVATPPSLAGDCADEKISSEEPISPWLSLKDALPTEKISPEGHFVNYSFFTKDVPQEKILPEVSVAKYQSLAEVNEVLPQKPLTETLSFAAAAPDNMMTPAEEPDAAHPSFSRAVQEEKISPEVPDSKSFSVPEASLQERNSLDEFVGVYPYLAEAVPDETLLAEKPASTSPSSTEPMHIANILPENSLQEKSDDATHPFCAESTPEETISAEVLDSTNSVLLAVLQEKISRDEVTSIDQCLAEAVHDERCLPEEPVTTENVLLEESIEMYPSLREENILDEEADDAAHLSSSQAVNDEIISPEVLDSTYVSVAEAVPQEPISLDEIIDIHPCLAEVVSDEKVLPEEPITTCLSLTNAVADEKILPEEVLETYPSLEKLPEEKILDEEADTHSSFSEAVIDEKISPEVLDSTNSSLEEAVTREQILLEEFVGMNPCFVEAVPDERGLPEVMPIEKNLPEEALEAYASLEKLSTEKLLQEESDDDIELSCATAVNDETVSPENLASTTLAMAETTPQEKFSLEAEAVRDEGVLPEEPVTTCLSAPIEKILPGEPFGVYRSLEEMPEEKIVHEEEPDDAANLSFSEAVGDENILLPEGPGSTYPSLEESVMPEQVSHEELVGTNPFSDLTVREEGIFQNQSGVTYKSSAEAVSEEKSSSEETLPTYLSLGEAAADEEISLEEPNEKIYVEESDEEISKEESDEKISVEEPDATCSPSAEDVFDENIPGSEAPGSTTEDVYGPYNKTFPEELVGTDLSLAEVVSDEEIPGSISPRSTTETGPYNKTFPEEPVAMDMSLAEAVIDEKISGSEAPSSTREAGPHDKTSSVEPVATDLFLDLAVPDEPDVTYQPSAEAVSKEKNLSEEPLLADTSSGEVSDEETSVGQPDKNISEPDEEISVEEPDESIHVEEPDATCSHSAEIVFDEEFLGSEAPGSTTEAGLHGETFHEEPVATNLSFDEVVSDEDMPGLISPRSTTETGPLNKTFPEELVATDLSLVENVFEEKISDSEAGPHDKTSSEEPVVTDLSLAEPVPDVNTLPKEPAAPYLNLAEGIPDQQVFLDDAAFLSFAEAIFDQKFSPEVPDSTYPSLTEPEIPLAAPSSVKESTASDVSMDQKNGTVTVSPDTQDSQSNGTSVEPVSIWSNGGLFGLAPLKPIVFAEPKSENTQNQINEASVSTTRKQELSSKSVEDNTEKSALPLVVSDPTSQHHRHSNGSHSLLQSTPTSFKVFGLSHKLLMAGFRGNSSSTCKFEAIPSTSYDNTKVAAIEDKTLGGSSFEEQLDHRSSLFGSPTSSPPAQHMKISFKTKDVSSVSKLQLRIPSQPQHNGENADMFPSFQLIPETSNSDDEEDSDIFCQSSPCVSDNCLSDSELWESDESPRKSVSGSQQEARERSKHSEIGSFSGSFLDLPCFDSVDHHQSTSSRTEQEQEDEQVTEHKPSVSDIIRAWPPNNPNDGLVIEDDDDGDR